MKYFAKIENNIVVNLVLAEDLSFLGEGEWVEYCVDGSFRKNPAAIGGEYDSSNDAFILVKPYPSWTLNESTFKWEAPTPKPVDAYYNWDEDSLAWYKMKDF
jgi:hypothetical protein